MASQIRQAHFILFPLMAPGHMIPMIDIAKVLAHHGVTVTILTTPRNAMRFNKSIDRAVLSGLRIQLLQLYFPSHEAGLPEGCENLDMLPALNMAANFFAAINMLRQEVEQSLDKVEPRPSCFISDAMLPWTTQIAQKFGIPRIVFHGTSCFTLLCSHNIISSKILDTISSETEYFIVPGLPEPRIELIKAQVSGTINPNSNTLLNNVRDQVREAEKTSYGVLVNTFEELELEYVKEYKRVKGKKVWCIGPVSLCNRDDLDKSERGKKAAIDEEHCLNWLDSCEPRSVIYVCLGSLSRPTPLQMMELAFGLEASKRAFLWAIGGGEDKLEALEKLICEDGFEERNKDKGLLIRGWAPQVLILSHKAIGGFLTHCGWNSTLEGISSGIPMVTWPQFADQFYNEKLVVQILEIGVSVGVMMPMRWGEEDKIGVVVKRENVEKAINSLMDEGFEAEERRRRAKDIAEVAVKAIEEEGSSHLNVKLLIQHIMKQSSP